MSKFKSLFGKSGDSTNSSNSDLRKPSLTGNPCDANENVKQDFNNELQVRGEEVVPAQNSPLSKFFGINKSATESSSSDSGPTSFAPFDKLKSLFNQGEEPVYQVRVEAKSQDKNLESEEEDSFERHELECQNSPRADNQIELENPNCLAESTFSSDVNEARHEEVNQDRVILKDFSNSIVSPSLNRKSINQGVESVPFSVTLGSSGNFVTNFNKEDIDELDNGDKELDSNANLSQQEEPPRAIFDLEPSDDEISSESEDSFVVYQVNEPKQPSPRKTGILPHLQRHDRPSKEDIGPIFSQNCLSVRSPSSRRHSTVSETIPEEEETEENSAVEQEFEGPVKECEELNAIEDNLLPDSEVYYIPEELLKSASFNSFDSESSSFGKRSTASAECYREFSEQTNEVILCNPEATSGSSLTWPRRHNISLFDKLNPSDEAKSAKASKGKLNIKKFIKKKGSSIKHSFKKLKKLKGSSEHIDETPGVKPRLPPSRPPPPTQLPKQESIEGPSTASIENDTEGIDYNSEEELPNLDPDPINLTPNKSKGFESNTADESDQFDTHVAESFKDCQLTREAKSPVAKDPFKEEDELLKEENVKWNVYPIVTPQGSFDEDDIFHPDGDIYDCKLQQDRSIEEPSSFADNFVDFDAEEQHEDLEPETNVTEPHENSNSKDFGENFADFENANIVFSSQGDDVKSQKEGVYHPGKTHRRLSKPLIEPQTLETITEDLSKSNDICSFEPDESLGY